MSESREITLDIGLGGAWTVQGLRQGARRCADADRDYGTANVARLLNRLADMIEEQTKPPKPVEPTGRYAVVEDRNGVEWVKADPGYGYTWKALTTDQWSAWDGIDVAHVHTEGKVL